jgi:nitroimidazol reductase NimA-like FMN-containing flavoprotein (pyridoxamine 5'-phosphate oxidase superfamily)
MNARQLADFLGIARYGVFATTRTDGRPHATPVGFVLTEGRFWIASLDGVRLRNLRTQPYGSLVVTRGSRTRHRAVLVEGPVELHPASAMPPLVCARWANRYGAEPTWAAALIELRPTRLFSHTAASATPPVGSLRELERDAAAAFAHARLTSTGSAERMGQSP